MSEYEVLKRGDRLSDRYVLERHLGRGGMGTVWLATDEELDGLPVAVKLLLPEYAQDAQFVASLKDEAKNSMKLAHPNIVRVFNFHRDNGDPGWTYLVLKYVPGRTMKELLGDSPQGLPVDRVLRWAGQLATALDYAHEAGMLHRDLKPSNMMIDENTDSALLMDFGISRQLDQTIAAQSGGSSIGTPVYMSPQALHNKDSAANDIYSFAAMLYEALSGRPPFTGPDIEEQILRVQAKPIPGIPDEVNEGILAGLAKEAEARPATATNLVAIMNDECNDTIFTDPVPPADTARSAHESSREAPAFAPLPMLVAALAIVVVGVALGAVPAISHPIRSLLGSGKPATPSAPGQPPVLTPQPDQTLRVMEPTPDFVAPGAVKPEPRVFAGDPNTMRPDGTYVLHYFVMKQQTGRVQEILAHPNVKLDVVRQTDGYTALHIAAQVGSADMIALLIDAGIDKEARAFAPEERPIHVAVRAGAISAVKKLVELGASVNSLDGGRNTPLHIAAERNPIDLTMIELLLDLGADRDVQNMSRKTPAEVIRDTGTAGAEARTLLTP